MKTLAVSLESVLPLKSLKYKHFFSNTTQNRRENNSASYKGYFAKISISM